MSIPIIAALCVLAVVLGIVNIVMGRRRLLLLRQQGQKLVWFKQLSILVGIEYVLLGLAFLLNISISNHWLSQSLVNVLLPVYLVLLLASGALAGVVIFQSIGNARRRTREQQAALQAQSRGQATSRVVEGEAHEVSAANRQLQTQQRRERKQKAAAARRRRAGRA